MPNTFLKCLIFVTILDTEDASETEEKQESTSSNQPRTEIKEQ